VEELRKLLARTEKRQRSLLRLLQRNLTHGTDIAAPAFEVHGYGIHSRQDEDGLLLHIFKNIGVCRRTFLEIGVQDGLECNTANLSRHLGWEGVLMEGDPDLAKEAERNYCAFTKVIVKQAFVTRENIDQLLSNCGVDRDCDLFSLDIDGNDYWIWEALADFRPRVVVIEYNHALGPERSVTIPYDPQFRHRAKHPRGYLGASLRAMQRLGARRGYALVGSSSFGPNAFFVRKEALAGEIREVSVEDAYRPLYIKRRGEDFPETLRGLPFVEVEVDE
jgi:hypothetical protein